MIQIEAVDKVFTAGKKQIQALKQVSIQIEKGEIFGVVGYSGAGKSTLIRLVNGLEKPNTGEVIVDGVNVNSLQGKALREFRKNIGMIFQQFNLLESQTVYRNIAIPLLLNKEKQEVIDKRIEELLSFVELKNKKDAYVSQLSGGQKQRVAIARALATNPKILLCDEATSALDPQTTESILTLLKKINRELGITILLITHEMHVIQKICDKVAVMKDGQIQEQGETISVFSQPREEITKRFVSTVIQADVPKILLQNLDHNDPIIKITFSKNNAKEALISYLNKNYDVETTILYATVHELQGTILGIVILQLHGKEAETNKVEQYIKDQHFKIERVVL